MGTSQRVSRGFHRLALVLSAIPLLVGTVLSLYWASDPTFADLTRHQHLVCAHEHIERVKKRLPSSNSPSAEKKRLLTDEEISAVPPKAKDADPDDWVEVPADSSLENNPYQLSFAPDQTTLNLKRMGCSDSNYETVSLGEASTTIPNFSWYPRLAFYFGFGVFISLVLSLAVYGLVRAIGWVIGGFTAS